MADPPLSAWEREGALRELVRIARGLDHEDFRADVMPRLRRLTAGQRALLARAVDDTVREARRRRDVRPPDA